MPAITPDEQKIIDFKNYLMSLGKYNGEINSEADNEFITEIKLLEEELAEAIDNKAPIGLIWQGNKINPQTSVADITEAFNILKTKGMLKAAEFKYKSKNKPKFQYRYKWPTDETEMLAAQKILAETGDRYIQENLAQNPDLDIEIQKLLAQSDDRYVLKTLAQNPNLYAEIQMLLVQKDDRYINNILLKNPNLNSEVKSIIDIKKEKGKGYKAAQISVCLNKPSQGRTSFAQATVDTFDVDEYMESPPSATKTNLTADETNIEYGDPANSQQIGKSVIELPKTASIDDRIIEFVKLSGNK